MSEEKTPHGTFCWNECVSTDVPASKYFYTKLLGWKEADESMPDMSYTWFKVGDKAIGGMLAMPPEAKGAPSHWMSYIAVDNVDELIEKTKELGGTIIHGPMDIPTVGRFVIIQDPAGAMVSLITLANQK